MAFSNYDRAFMALIELRDVAKVYQLGEVEVHALASVTLKY